MRTTLLFLSAAGFALFAAVFVVSYVSPLTIESAAREIVRMEVQRRVASRIEELSNARVVTLAQKALGQTELEIQQAKSALLAEVPQRVANAVADMLNADCECRMRLVRAATRGAEERVTALGQVRERLNGLIESAYANVRSNLLRELRIFAGANALAFALLALITLYRRAAALQLLLPAVVLVGAVALTAVLYLFNQDWLHTIVYSEYVGFGYAAYLAVVAACFADVVFNRARLTTKAVNMAFSLVGSALHAAPC